jgi:hypothetical protein
MAKKQSARKTPLAAEVLPLGLRPWPRQRLRRSGANVASTAERRACLSGWLSPPRPSVGWGVRRGAAPCPRSFPAWSDAHFVEGGGARRPVRPPRRVSSSRRRSGRVRDASASKRLLGMDVRKSRTVCAHAARSERRRASFVYRRRGPTWVRRSRGRARATTEVTHCALETSHYRWARLRE